MGTVVQMGPTVFCTELWPHWKSPSVIFPASVYRIHCSLFFHQAQGFCILLPVYETKRSTWFWSLTLQAKHFGCQWWFCSHFVLWHLISGLYKNAQTWLHVMEVWIAVTGVENSLQVVSLHSFFLSLRLWKNIIQISFPKLSWKIGQIISCLMYS